MTGTPSRLVCWLAEAVNRLIGWSRLPTPLGLMVLVGLRTRLREHNLYSTRRGPLDKPSYQDPNVENRFGARTMNGTYWCSPAKES